ncbi:MAG: DUF2786 domain-containing protein, partial [Streptosporangiaceae bacterium]
MSRGPLSASLLHLNTTADFLACYCPLSLSGPGKPSGPGTSLPFLPAAPGIQQSASWRMRVRKLLAKAEAQGVTPAEAEALTAKAAELMARYGIDRALL